jgi:hypothetical protein
MFTTPNIRRAAYLVPLTMALSVLISSPSGAVETTCKPVGVTPSKIAVGLSPVTRTMNVKTTGCTSPIWKLSFENSDLTANDLEPTLFLAPEKMINLLAGPWLVSALVADTGPSSTTSAKQFTVSIVRRATFGSTFNAAPESVTKNQNITLTGTLGRANWDTMTYVGYSGRQIKVQFKPTGDTTFTTIKTVTSQAKGKIKTTVKATKSGTWRFSYGGNSVTGSAVSSGDAITVS